MPDQITRSGRSTGLDGVFVARPDEAEIAKPLDLDERPLEARECPALSPVNLVPLVGPSASDLSPDYS